VAPSETYDAPYDLAEWRELTKKAQWDSLHAYGDLLTRVVPEGWPRRLADLNVRYYEEVLKGSQALTDQWLDAVERAVPTRPGEHREPSNGVRGPRLIPISLHATVGETARGSISLRNTEQVETEISFLVSDFTASDGRSIRPVVAISPERFVLGPYDERLVVLDVMLDPDLFPPRKLFRGAVAVRGYDNLELSVTVWSDEPDE
jgi:hypothetical protein